MTGRAFERAKEVDEKCRNENNVERGEKIDVLRMLREGLIFYRR
jgi:hypothetical protein